MQKYLVLNCSRTTATIIIFATIFLFILIGCQSLFRSAGLTDEEATLQIAQLEAAVADATTAAIADAQAGLAAGHDLKTIAIRTSSAFIWKIIAAASASVGVVLNGLLAKWLSTEKKITKTLITGIENNDSQTTKEAVRLTAIAAGTQKQLRKRVASLT